MGEAGKNKRMLNASLRMFFCLAKPKELSQSLAEMQSEKELYMII